MAEFKAVDLLKALDLESKKKLIFRSFVQMIFVIELQELSLSAEKILEPV